MNIILLSGGSGKRLWPLSNEVRSKQFIKIFKTDDQQCESMVQRIYRQIKTVDDEARITIATSKSQVSSIHNQLGEKVDISIEPYRRDTFPAIALATTYLHDIKGISEEDSVVVCPVDPYVDNSYFMMLQKLSEQAKKNESNLILMGIKPTFPSEKYGYIIPQDKSEISYVSSFKEKPDEKTAEYYLSQGALWNGGVFAYKLKYVLDIAKKVFGTSDYHQLFNNYKNLQKISFDYAVVEKENSVQVMKYSGEWKDVGSWNTLTETMSENYIGDVTVDETCNNVHIINELGIPVLAMGIQNAVITVSSDGVLVSDKERSGYIKKYAEKYDGDVKYADKSWGCFRVIDAGNDSLTIKVTIKAGDGMRYHAHTHRDEVWVVVSGNGRTLIDGIEKKVSVGDVVKMNAGCRHTIYAITELVLIEVQLGKEISVHDKKIYPDYPQNKEIVYEDISNRS